LENDHQYKRHFYPNSSNPHPQVYNGSMKNYFYMLLGLFRIEVDVETELKLLGQKQSSLVKFSCARNNNGAFQKGVEYYKRFFGGADMTGQRLPELFVEDQKLVKRVVRDGTLTDQVFVIVEQREGEKIEIIEPLKFVL
jgi:hypothetical protein